MKILLCMLGTIIMSGTSAATEGNFSADAQGAPSIFGISATSSTPNPPYDFLRPLPNLPIPDHLCGADDDVFPMRNFPARWWRPMVPSLQNSSSMPSLRASGGK
jgi:hypothetical protein